MKSLLLAIAILAGCNPYLQQQSVAPPGRSARLDEVNGFWGLKRYRLEVSEGVALALTCNHGGPCEKMTVVSEDPAIAEVRLASLAALQATTYAGLNPQPSAAFVVIGKGPGTTRLKVTAREGTRHVVVTVIPAPTPVQTASAISPVAR